MKERMLTVRITEELQQQFNDTCRKNDLAKSAVVNTLIREFVDKKEREGKG